MFSVLGEVASGSQDLLQYCSLLQTERLTYTCWVTSPLYSGSEHYSSGCSAWRTSRGRHSHGWVGTDAQRGSAWCARLPLQPAHLYKQECWDCSPSCWLQNQTMLLFTSFFGGARRRSRLNKRTPDSSERGSTTCSASYSLLEAKNRKRTIVNVPPGCTWELLRWWLLTFKKQLFCSSEPSI